MGFHVQLLAIIHEASTTRFAPYGSFHGGSSSMNLSFRHSAQASIVNCPYRRPNISNHRLPVRSVRTDVMTPDLHGYDDVSLTQWLGIAGRHVHPDFKPSYSGRKADRTFAGEIPIDTPYPIARITCREPPPRGRKPRATLRSKACRHAESIRARAFGRRAASSLGLFPRDRSPKPMNQPASRNGSRRDR